MSENEDGRTGDNPGCWIAAIVMFSLLMLPLAKVAGGILAAIFPQWLVGLGLVIGIPLWLLSALGSTSED